MPRTNAVVWYCVTTDQGSNEFHARKQIRAATSSLKQVLFLDCNCLGHQGHLAVHAGLLFLDEALKEHQRTWKYYSSLAIFSSCVRDLASSVFQKWEQFYGSSSAMKHVRTLIPKSNAGRWGCVHEIEGRILQVPFHMWTHCLNHVILEKLQLSAEDLEVLKDVLPNDVARMFGSKKPKTGPTKPKAKTKKPGIDVGDGKVDTLAVEQMAEHAARIGRWRRHLLLTINDRLFGHLIEISHKARNPLIHFSSWLKQDIATEELNKIGGKLHQLICFKGAMFTQEFEDLLCCLLGEVGTFNLFSFEVTSTKVCLDWNTPHAAIDFRRGYRME